MSKTIAMTVNGTPHAVAAAANTPLIYALRNDLDLKGTRLGCGEGTCGCCTVLLNGRAVQSCNTPLAAAENASVTTIEGLGTDAAPHPLQQAFIAEQAGQCGYCITGFIMGAASLLAQNPNPSDAEIKTALDVHLCRCGAYGRILRAIKRAGQQMRGA